MQRQILYTKDSIGRPKVDEAASALKRFNPEVSIEPLQKRVEEQQLQNLVAAVDVVLDCSDNFATRHAINRACVKHRKPLVSGAAIRFDGQLMVFDLSKPSSPCYACVFPEGGEGEELRCAVTGVLAPLTGVIGALQAMEAIKLIAGAGHALDGLLIFDAKTTGWRAVRASKDPSCPACSVQ